MMYIDYHIDVDSFGADCPQNWEKIAAWFNDLIDAQINAHPDLLDELGDMTPDGRDWLGDLWERYWSGDIPDAPKPIGNIAYD